MDCSAVPDGAQLFGTAICIVTPPDWRIYITPLLVAISAGIAYRAMRTTRAVARQRATLDLIEKRESSDHYRAAAATFSRIRRAGGFAALSRGDTPEAAEARRAVVDYLNHYELISIGILNDILDERIYRTWMRGPFTRDWNAAAAWIQQERWKRDASGRWVYYPPVFENYQKVALRWSRDTIRLSKDWAPPPPDEQAGGPGDEVLPSFTEPT